MAGGRYKTISGERLEYLISEYKRGRSAANIGLELGVCSGTVINYLKEAKVEIRKAGHYKAIPEDVVKIAAEMRAKRIRWKVVVGKLGYCKESLHANIKVLTGKATESRIPDGVVDTAIKLRAANTLWKDVEKETGYSKRALSRRIREVQAA